MMGHCIIKIKDRYLEWSSVVDAPITHGMTREEFEKYYLYEYGESGMRDLTERLDRADETGTSGRGWGTVEDIIASNRAGKNGRRLTLNGIYKEYCQDGEPVCKYCGSPFNGDRDENGALFCDCTEAQLERTTARAAELEAELAVACHFKAGDRVEFDYAVLDKIAELEAENKRLREASKSAIEALSDAQGEWAAVERWHAPEWTHPLKQAIDELEAALKGGEE